MIPESLERILSEWPATRPRPKVRQRLPAPAPAHLYVLTRRRAVRGCVVQFVYTIPNGSNPSGGSLTEARKRAIYALAQKHKLLILEDGIPAGGGRVGP